MKIKHSETYDEFHLKVDETTGKHIVYAMDAEEGKDYLLVGDYYKMKVVEKHGIVDNDIMDVTSVDVESEREPYKTISIAGGTELIEYDEKLHFRTLPSEESTPGKPTKREKKMSSEKKEKGPSKGSIIDSVLDTVETGKEPDFTVIVKAIHEAGIPEDDNRIIKYAKVRWYRFYKKGEPKTSKKMRKEKMSEENPEGGV